MKYTSKELGKNDCNSFTETKERYRIILKKIYMK